MPPISISLLDGSKFSVVETDAGTKLMHGGGRWQRFFCKIIGRNLPSFVHNQPTISPSAYTIGIDIVLRREMPATNPVTTPWNGTGQFYVVNPAGIEEWGALRGVNFLTELRGTQYMVVAEELEIEIPAQPEKELNLKLYETNKATGAVITNSFRLKNPGY